MRSANLETVNKVVQEVLDGPIRDLQLKTEALERSLLELESREKKLSFENTVLAAKVQDLQYRLSRRMNAMEKDLETRSRWNEDQIEALRCGYHDILAQRARDDTALNTIIRALQTSIDTVERRLTSVEEANRTHASTALDLSAAVNQLATVLVSVRQAVQTEHGGTDAIESRLVVMENVIKLLYERVTERED